MPKFFLKHLLIYIVVAATLIILTIYSVRHPDRDIGVTYLIYAIAAYWIVLYPVFVAIQLLRRVVSFIKNVRQRIRSGELVTSADYYQVVEFCAATAGKEAWIPRSVTKWALRKFLKQTIQDVIEKKFGKRLGLQNKLPPQTPSTLEETA